jgi:hypothetical protein
MPVEVADAELSLLFGFDGWIVKPVDLQRLDLILQGVKNPGLKGTPCMFRVSGKGRLAVAVSVSGTPMVSTFSQSVEIPKSIIASQRPTGILC